LGTAKVGLFVDKSKCHDYIIEIPRPVGSWFFVFIFSVTLFKIYLMRYLKPFLFLLLAASFAACTRPTSNTNTVSSTNLSASGTLQAQGFTTYMYGTHLLVVNSATTYVLKSSTLNLDPYIGKKVKLTAVNTHYTAENGPELYDVTYIALQ
jgi:hypothetical protein